MGFDNANNGPIVQPAKKTTKVNFSLAAGVLIFIAIGFAAIAWMRFFHG
jgi:hypothetical protein